MRLRLTDRPLIGIVTAVNRQLHKVDVHLGRYSKLPDPHRRRQLLLHHLEVDLVVDVGANVGQYGAHLRRAGYDGPILSLEPMRGPYDALQQRAAQDGRWTTIRSAAGAQEGQSTIVVTQNSVSSSLLPMLDRHRQAAKGSVSVGSELVAVQRLDRLLPEHLRDVRRPFLKVDTQGFERDVLRGAAGVLHRFVGLEMEMSLVPLYEGQMLYREALDFMEAEGFRLVAVTPGFTDKATGEVLQVDGIFAR